MVKNNSAEMSGGQYFGSSYVNWSDNNSADSQLCNAMVGGTINIYSSNSAEFSTSGCATKNMRAPRTAHQIFIVE